LAVLSSLLSELEWAGAEHEDVSLAHESGWCLSVSRSGFTTLEHLERGGPCRLRGLSRMKILDLWMKLARGNIQDIESEAWIHDITV
jgi:hypothetical protein